MALIYQAELTPSKIDLIEHWVRTQPWFAGSDTAELSNVAAYRFDDPDGEVGIETLLVQAGNGPVLQVPLTYRAAPLKDADSWLIGTMEHSVLGRRYVYDAVGDPVYLTAVATAVLTGGRDSDQYVSTDGELVRRNSTARVLGSGATDTPVPSISAATAVAVRHENGRTIVHADSLHFVLVRTANPMSPPQSDDVTGAAGLTGTWTGQPDAVTLGWVLAP